MRWKSEWAALSATIDRLRDAGDFLVSADRSLGALGSERGLGVYWCPAINRTAAAVAHFLERNRSYLTGPASGIVNWYSQMYAGNFPLAGGSFQSLQLGLSHLLAAQAELSLAIGDFELAGRRLVERAWMHLQRSLIVDSFQRERWWRALEESGERGCEKLGAVHLLGHGIWAFKVDEAGERTDLVLGEPIHTPAEEVVRSADLLVLTEWKVAEQRTARSVVEQAVRQAKLYSAGVLGGVELETVRYIVLVSRERLDAIPDQVDDNITYRHINVALVPKTPSRERAAIAAPPEV